MLALSMIFFLTLGAVFLAGILTFRKWQRIDAPHYTQDNWTKAFIEHHPGCSPQLAKALYVTMSQGANFHHMKEVLWFLFPFPHILNKAFYLASWLLWQRLPVSPEKREVKS